MTVKYLTIPEVAKRLGVSRRTVYSYMQGRFVKQPNGKTVSKYEFCLLSDRLPSGEIRISTTQLSRFMTWCRQFGPESPGIICPECGHTWFPYDKKH